MNCGYLAQHLYICHGNVILEKRVATCDPLGAVLFDYTMDDEPAVPRDEYNVARNDFFAGPVLDAENFSRPDRRKHAGSECPKAYCAARSENFNRKVELMSFAGLGQKGHGWPKNYELFRLKRH
jgi:hypothetical protein